MLEPDQLILLAIAYLLVKHALGDFFLQTSYQYKNKGRYGHPGGLLHALIHIVLTAPVFLLFPASGGRMAAVLASEFVLHYHIDWLKERLLARGGWDVGSGAYWRVLGLDQLVHGLTYVAVVWAISP